MPKVDAAPLCPYLVEMHRLVVILPALVGLALASPILAASSEDVATRTGEIIGAASACGVPDDELIALGRKVIGWARDAARDAAELRRAQAAHEAAGQTRGRSDRESRPDRVRCHHQSLPGARTREKVVRVCLLQCPKNTGPPLRSHRVKALQLRKRGVV